MIAIRIHPMNNLHVFLPEGSSEDLRCSFLEFFIVLPQADNSAESQRKLTHKFIVKVSFEDIDHSFLNVIAGHIGFFRGLCVAQATRG